MDGWMDRWIDRSMERWIDGSMDRWIDGSMDRWIDGSMDQWIDGSMDGGMEGSTDRLIDRSMPIDRSIDRCNIAMSNIPEIEGMRVCFHKARHLHGPAIDQSIDRSIRSVNQSIDGLINRSITKPVICMVQQDNIGASRF